MSNLEHFADQYNWKKINFSSHPSKHRKKFELNNKSIALNILFVPTCIPTKKYYFKRENQVILLMITYGKKWHYLAVKGLLALLRGIKHQIIRKTFIV